MGAQIPPPSRSSPAQHGEGSRELHELAGPAASDGITAKIDLFDILNNHLVASVEWEPADSHLSLSLLSLRRPGGPALVCSVVSEQ